MDSISISDAFVAALVESPAAQSLRTFSAKNSRLTDRSCAVWPRFLRLKNLNLSLNKRLSSLTLRQIALCQDLINLKMSPPSVGSDSDLFAEVIAILLEGSSLPSLKELHMFQLRGKGLHDLRVLSDGLSRRKADLPQLEVLNFDIRDVGTPCFPIIAEIHTKCPNLRQFVCCSQEFLSYIGSTSTAFPYLTRLHGKLFISSSMVGSLSKMCPNLREADLSFRDAANLSDFEAFSRMQVLCINLFYGSSGSAALSLPASLVDLNIRNSDAFSELETNNLIDSITSHCPNLRNILIKQRGNFFLRHLDEVLRTLTRVRTLKLVGQKGPPSVSCDYVVSHPSLLDLPECVFHRKVKLIPGFLPGMSFIDLRDLSLENLSNHPFATELVANNTRSEVLSADQAYLLRSSSAWRISALSSKTGWAATCAVKMIHLGPLWSLHHIKSLTLDEIGGSQEHVSMLLQNLPLLRALKCTVETSDTSGDLSWVKHPKLVDLTLLLLLPDGETQFTAGATLPGQGLPLLKELHVQFCHRKWEMVLPSRFQLSRFPRLEILTITSPVPTNHEWNVTDLVIFNMPFLCHVSMLTIGIASFSMHDVPFLVSLGMRNIFNAENIMIGRFDVPASVRLDVPARVLKQVSDPKNRLATKAI
jgi:hypothetical protein